MAISRAQLVKELEPGLNALFGLEYNSYDNEHTEIYEVESSDRAFEEEVMLSGFAEAPVKTEGAGVAYDQAQEVYTARYTHETVALAVYRLVIRKPLLVQWRLLSRLKVRLFSMAHLLHLLVETECLSAP